MGCTAPSYAENLYIEKPTERVLAQAQSIIAWHGSNIHSERYSFALMTPSVYSDL